MPIITKTRLRADQSTERIEEYDSSSGKLLARLYYSTNENLEKAETYDLATGALHAIIHYGPDERPTRTDFYNSRGALHQYMLPMHDDHGRHQAIYDSATGQLLARTYLRPDYTPSHTEHYDATGRIKDPTYPANNAWRPRIITNLPPRPMPPRFRLVANGSSRVV